MRAQWVLVVPTPWIFLPVIFFLFLKLSLAQLLAADPSFSSMVNSQMHTHQWWQNTYYSGADSDQQCNLINLNSKSASLNLLHAHYCKVFNPCATNTFLSVDHISCTSYVQSMCNKNTFLSVYHISCALYVYTYHDWSTTGSRLFCPIYQFCQYEFNIERME